MATTLYKMDSFYNSIPISAEKGKNVAVQKNKYKGLVYKAGVDGYKGGIP